MEKMNLNDAKALDLVCELIDRISDMAAVTARLQSTAKCNWVINEADVRDYDPVEMCSYLHKCIIELYGKAE